MRLYSLARALGQVIREKFGSPKTQAEAMMLVSMLPRNRAEARRLNATGVARVSGGGGGRGKRTLETTHRRIAADQARQAERAAGGRHAW